jgi:putative Mn2+ efflux pump MntP
MLLNLMVVALLVVAVALGLNNFGSAARWAGAGILFVTAV